jgi:hypothetical protein
MMKIHFLRWEIHSSKADRNLSCSAEDSALGQTKEAAQFDRKLHLTSTAAEYRVCFNPEDFCICDSARH